MVSISAAAEYDIPWILEIEREAISPPWTHGTLLGEMYSVDSFFAVAHETPGCGGDRVQLDDGRRHEGLGFVILRRIGDNGELLQIAVDKAVRRHGVADKLMCAALEFAGKSSLRSVFLEVRKSNESAFALYIKHGFVTVHQRAGYYSEPIEDAIVMVCYENRHQSLPHFPTF